MNQLNCWALEYQPTFKNLCFPLSLKTRLQNITKNKGIPLNLYLYGMDGSGKTTIIKTLLKECFNINDSDLIECQEFENSFFYDTIYSFDFYNLNQTQTKTIIDFIRKYALRNVFSSNQKLIILRHIESLENNKYLNMLKNLINKYSSHCIFIISSNKMYQNFKGLCCNIRIGRLNQENFKDLIKQINKKYKIDFKNSPFKSNYKLIYKYYQDSNFNLKDIIIWYQYIILSDTKPTMMIKNKIIASLIKHIFIKENNFKNFTQIRGKIMDSLGIGMTENEILQIFLKLVVNNKKINLKLKQKVIDEICNISRDIMLMDRKLFGLEKIFNEIHIYFLNN